MPDKPWALLLGLARVAFRGAPLAQQKADVPRLKTGNEETSHYRD